MRPCTDEYLQAVRATHRMHARARVLTTFQTGTNPTGVTIPILSGAVKMDARADIRSRLDLTTDGTDWDHTPAGLITPYGNEIFVERGVELIGSMIEWVSLGYFRIYGCPQEEAPDGPIDVEARDRMSGLIDARLEAPVQYLASNTVGQVFDDLVTAVYPGATITFDDALDGELLGRTVVAEEKRYEFLRDLATSYGKVMWWDHLGVLQVASPPDPGVPVLDVNHGAGGILVSLSKEVSREGVYNAVVATGEGADGTTPAFGVARDLNPNSPTYYFGKFGPVPRFYNSQFIKDDTQATAAARSLLMQSLGLPYNVDLAAVPNPCLEVLDPVRVAYDYDRAPEIHVLDELTVGLTATDPMTGTSRQFVQEVT